MSVSWTGVDALARKLRVDPTHLLAGALFEEGEHIMGQAKQLTPVKTGRLRASGHVKPPETSGTTVTVELAFGTDYAIYVHEIEGRNHPVGQAKFLEQPVKAAAGGFSGRIKRRIGDRLFNAR